MEVFSVLQLFELFSWFFLMFYVVYCFTQQTTAGKIFKKEYTAHPNKRGVKRPRSRYTEDIRVTDKMTGKVEDTLKYKNLQKQTEQLERDMLIIVNYFVKEKTK